MKKIRSASRALQSYFEIGWPNQRNVSHHTIISYRDSLASCSFASSRSNSSET